MSAKPALTMQVDAQGAVEKVAATIEEMAQNQTQAMSETVGQMAQAVNVLTEAVQKLGGPRRKIAVGPSGKRYEMIDEAAE
jgi:methyl-accepting chemotaxis protein